MGVPDYVKAVLVPELAVMLIIEDMRVDEEMARSILQKSARPGELLNDELALWCGFISWVMSRRMYTLGCYLYTLSILRKRSPPGVLARRMFLPGGCACSANGFFRPVFFRSP